MLKRRVGRQDGVVGLDNRARQLGSGVHAELELGLLAVVVRETLHKERSETRASSTTERVENEEALETRAVVREPANLVHDEVDLFLADRVVATGIYATL